MPGKDGAFADTAAMCSHSSPVATVTGTNALRLNISFRTSAIFVSDNGINLAKRFNTASGSLVCSRTI